MFLPATLRQPAYMVAREGNSLANLQLGEFGIFLRREREPTGEGAPEEDGVGDDVEAAAAVLFW